MGKIGNTLILGGTALALGISLAWHFKRAGDPAAVVASPSSSPVTSQTAGMGAYAEVWSKEAAARMPMPDQPAASPAGKNRSEAGMDAMRELRTRAQADPATLQALIQRFGNERDPQARETLKATLAALGQPEVMDLAKRLAGSKDAGQRRDGLDLLQRLAIDSADARNVVRQILASEQSPVVLAQALGALKPAPVDPVEGRQIVTQLESLSRNPDTAVRRQSVFRLGQWARNGEADARLIEALQDQAPEVRQAAILALGQSQARSDGAKGALLALMNNPGESRQVRDGAVQALERYSLTAEETAALRQVRMQLHGY